MLGKIPPQDLDLEMALLGSILLIPETLGRIEHLLNENVFYSEGNKSIYKAIRKLSDENKPIDILTVTNELRQAKELEIAGGVHYVSTLLNKVSSGAHSEFHAHILYEKFAKRHLITLCDQIKEKAYDDSIEPFQLALDIQDSAYSVVSVLDAHKKMKSISEVVSELVTDVSEKQTKGITFSGQRTGIAEMDKLTGGWQQGELIVLGGRPGMGKSVRAMKFMRQITKNGGSGVFFALEMSDRQLASRVVASETGVTLQDLKENRVGDNHWKQVAKMLKDMEGEKLSIQDAVGINLTKLKSDLEAHILKYGSLDFVVVDYLQLMKPIGSYGTDAAAIGSISKGLKNIAKEFKISVLALSQLNRALEHRPDKRPKMSDFRESGQIEQDADIMGYFYRPAYYNGFNSSLAEDGEYRGNCYDEKTYNRLFEIGILKNRQGSLGYTLEKFIGEHANFHQLDAQSIEIGAHTPDDAVPF